MSDYNDALEAATKLSDLSDEELYKQLGIRVAAANEDEQAPIAQNYDGDFAALVPDMGATDFLRKLGAKWWANLEPKLMAMVCDPANDDLKKLTSNRSIPHVAAGLATAGVMAIAAAPPAWIIVATTILATKLAESGQEALCQVWSEERETKP